MQQLVGNDRVVHTHATLVEHPHDRLSGKQTAAQSSLPYLRGEAGILTSLNFETCEVSCFTFPFSSHCAQILSKKLVFEILAPESAILHAGLGQAPIQI